MLQQRKINTNLYKNIFFFFHFFSLKETSETVETELSLLLGENKQKIILSYMETSIFKSFSFFFLKETLAIGYWIQFYSSYVLTVSIYVGCNCVLITTGWILEYNGTRPKGFGLKQAISESHHFKHFFWVIFTHIATGEKRSFGIIYTLCYWSKCTA